MSQDEEIETGYFLTNDSQDLIHKRDPYETKERRIARDRSEISRIRLSRRLEIINEPVLLSTNDPHLLEFDPGPDESEPPGYDICLEDIIGELNETPRVVNVERPALRKDSSRSIQELACDDVIVDLSELTISPEPAQRCHIYGCLGTIVNEDISLLCSEHFQRGITERWPSQDLFPPVNFLPQIRKQK